MSTEPATIPSEASGGALALPGSLDVDPDAPVVTLVYAQCREDGETSPWQAEDHTTRATGHYEWMSDHRQATGHRQFYTWTLTRSTARSYF